MATYDELSLSVRLFLKGYPFRRYSVASTPLAQMRVSMASARFALITSAGFHLPGQPGFDSGIRLGDPSFREIPGGVAVDDLVEGHRSASFDHAGITEDKNLAFPLDRFREFVADGTIGALNDRHFSFMGSIVGPGPLIRETAPEVARELREDGVDAVFLTPV